MTAYLAIPFAFVLGYLVAYRRARPLQVLAWEGITAEEIEKLIVDVETAHMAKVGRAHD